MNKGLLLRIEMSVVISYESQGTVLQPSKAACMAAVLNHFGEYED